MKDELISLETAKLAKEVGFNIETKYFYNDLNIVGDAYAKIEYYPIGYGQFEVFSELEFNYNGKPSFDEIVISRTPKKEVKEELISAPTQSLLHKWIREEHDTLICVYSNASGFLWEHMKSNSGTHIGWSDVSGPNDSGCWDTYEEAYEDGLKEVLKQIKIEKAETNINRKITL